ncbi:MAG: hypothetical protein LLF76_08125 [Planctomycetaceae bacterium]|nr:hypothetical protein [Planctomycetaceae bacterium]
MNESQNEQIVTLLPMQLKDDGAFANNASMDISGAGEASVEFLVGTIDAAIGSGGEDVAPFLEECDTDSVTAGDWTKITGAELAAPIASTKSDKIYRIDVPMKGARKKRVRVNVPHAGNGDTGANLMIIGRIRKMDIGPLTAANRGYEAHIIP